MGDPILMAESGHYSDELRGRFNPDDEVWKSEKTDPTHILTRPRGVREQLQDLTDALEGTIFKVYAALMKSGLTHKQATDAINEMQNEGILFREIHED